MIDHKVLLSATISVLLAALWCGQGEAGSKFPTQFGSLRCAENMSCIVNDPPKFSVLVEGPKMSIPEAATLHTLSDCTSKFDKRPKSETIRICEGYLSRNIGSMRDQSRAMFVLGHAYARSRPATVNSRKITDTKPFKMWSKAAELDPTNIEPLLSIGNMFGWSGDTDQAQAVFDNAEKINPNDWRIYTGRANALYNAHTQVGVPLAMLAAEKAAAIKPDEPLVRMVYGRMLQANERYEDAAKQYEAAIGKYDPAQDTSLELIREPDPLQSLAYVYNRLGRPALAAETLTKYLDSVPVVNHNYMLYQERAEFYELAGMFGKAAEDFKEAGLRAPPEYRDDLRTKAAVVLAKAGAKSEAGDELRGLLARGSLKVTLKVQVFLRDQGYDEVTINGKYDNATKRALEACLSDKQCAPGIGQEI